jgi:hypothetical protein
MPRGRECRQKALSEFELVAGFERAIGTARPGRCGDGDTAAVYPLEQPRRGDVIGMDMRIHGVLEAQAKLR